MDAPNERQIVPAVSHLADDALVELTYDARSRKTRFAIGQNGRWQLADEFLAASGETLVPYSATNNLIAHECVLLPSEPVGFGDKAALLGDIEDYLHRYVDFSPLFQRIAAHYILLTWVYDAFNELPYLRLKGDYGSGKTRALIALGSIAYKGFFASGASTVSPIFHTLDAFGGTLVLDEADLRFSDKTADLVKILNNGTVRGLPVLRTLTSRNREFSPAAFAVYGPKIIAMRGTFGDRALESRFITEQMGVRPLRSDIPIQLPSSLKDEALSLRNRLLDYRLQSRGTVASDPSRVIGGVDPRVNQTALSLLSLVDEPGLRIEIAQMLRAHQASVATERGDEAEARTAWALRDAMKASTGAYIPISEIVKHVGLSVSDPTAVLSSRDVGRVLRSLGIPIHKSHGSIVVPLSAREASEALAQKYDESVEKRF